MALQTEVKVIDQASPAIAGVMQSLSKAGLRDLNRIGARASHQAVKTYHINFDRAGGWFNRSLPTWGGGRTRTQWPKEVVNAWSVRKLSSRGFT